MGKKVADLTRPLRASSLAVLLRHDYHLRVPSSLNGKDTLQGATGPVALSLTARLVSIGSSSFRFCRSRRRKAGMEEHIGHSQIAVTLRPACTSCARCIMEAAANMNALFAGMSGELLGRHLIGWPGA